MNMESNWLMTWVSFTPVQQRGHYITIHGSTLKSYTSLSRMQIKCSQSMRIVCMF